MPADPRLLIAESLARLGVALPPNFETTPFLKQRELLVAWKMDTMEPAWKRLAMKLHPDRNPDRDTTAEMQAVNAARDVLRQLDVRPPAPPPRPMPQGFQVLVNGVPMGFSGTHTSADGATIHMTWIRWG